MSSKQEIQELRQKRQESLDAAKAVKQKAADEDRDLTDEELTELEGHTAEAKRLREEIAAAEEAEQKRLRALAALESEAEQEDVVQTPLVRPNPSPTGNGQTRPPAKPKKPEFENFAHYLQMVTRAATDPEEHGQLSRRVMAASGLNTVIDSEGGFLIPPEFSSTILEKMYQSGEILRRCRNLPLSGNTYKVPYVNESSRADGSRWGGVRGYWREEGRTVTATQPDFGQLELNLKSAMAISYVTEEQLQDYGATASFLEQALSEELTFVVEKAIYRGTGAGQPMGILNAPCVVQVSKETNQTATTIWGPNIVKMYAQFFARSRRSPVACWFYNQDCEPYLSSLALEGRYGSASTSVDAIPLWYPAGSAMNPNSQFATLMGLPAIPVEHASTLGTAGDIMLTDLSQYLLATKQGAGIQSDSSIHVRFLYAERTYRVAYRVDGRPWWSSALTPAQGSNTQSPFLKLETRS